MLIKIRRGDILYADLGVQYHGSMQGGMRPVVVVSNNRANTHSTVITVVPLSTRIYKKQSLPTHVFISACKAEGLEHHSIALCEQVTALSVASVPYGSMNFFRGRNGMLFEELQSVDIRTVKPEDVVDIQQIKIEDGLSQQEKRREFIRQVKNPYCFRVGKVIVKASYSGNGVSLNERFEELVMSV